MFAFSHRTFRGEDDLTAAVFGLMNYLPAEEFAFPFFHLLAARPGSPFSWNEEEPPSEVQFVPWPSLPVPKDLGERFHKTRDSVTPDAAFRLQYGDGRKVEVFIESEWSHIVEAIQLAQQWAALVRNAESGTTTHLLLVNRTVGWPAADPEALAAMPGERGLLTWVNKAASHYLSVATQASLMHVSWLEIVELALRVRNRSWAYRPLFDGLLEWLQHNGVRAALRPRDVAEFFPMEVASDLRASIQDRVPEVLAIDRAVDDRRLAFVASRPVLLDCPNPDKVGLYSKARTTLKETTQ